MRLVTTTVRGKVAAMAASLCTQYSIEPKMAVLHDFIQKVWGLFAHMYQNSLFFKLQLCNLRLKLK
jgi:hypothetical protein